MSKRFFILPATILVLACNPPITTGRVITGTTGNGTPYQAEEVLKISQTIPVYLSESEIPNRKFTKLSYFTASYGVAKKIPFTMQGVSDALRHYFYFNKLKGNAILYLRHQKIGEWKSSPGDDFEIDAVTIRIDD